MYILHTFLKVLTRRICLAIKSFFSWWSLFSPDVNVCFRSDIVMGNKMLVTLKDLMINGLCWTWSFSCFLQLLFIPFHLMVREQYLPSRAPEEVVTIACVRWVTWREFGWFTVTCLWFRICLNLTLLRGEIEGLCLIGSYASLSKCLQHILIECCKATILRNISDFNNLDGQSEKKENAKRR